MRWFPLLHCENVASICLFSRRFYPFFFSFPRWQRQPIPGETGGVSALLKGPTVTPLLTLGFEPATFLMFLMNSWQAGL